jgi:SSS family solute:Na+ symporter
MSLTTIDWIVIVGYLLINLLIGMYYRRRASGNTKDFFLSGREVSWWLAGTSMVATTFAADTPLLVSGLVATQGIAGNWIWWSMCLSGMLTVFFFARYWRRAEVLTDVELAEIRYSGKPAAFLRGFKAVYLGLIMNCLILGWVTNAMVSIVSVLLGPLIAEGRVLEITAGGRTIFHYALGAPNHTALFICVFILIPFTGIYTSLGGLWGVLVTDLFQFILKMAMVVVLAWTAVAKLGGMDALKLQLAHVSEVTRASGTAVSDPLSFFPETHQGWTADSLWTLPLLTFTTYLALQWWSAWYPGAEPGGGGYVAQRMFSARNEKHSLGATLWFNIAHYALRPWPWIITGLVALAVYSPHGGLHPNEAFGANPQQGYVLVLRDYLPPALRGFMVAAFLAAYMSTLGTQLNWGVSYLVNDFYRRFITRHKSESHYVNAGKIFTIVLVLASGYVAGQLTSIRQGWQVVLNLGIGTGAVYILRWYWWRINAWSEIVAMMVAAAITFTLSHVRFTGNDAVVFAKTAIITAGGTTASWIVATLLTRPEPEKTLLDFYRRVRPTVYGWRKIALLAPEITPVKDLAANGLDWVLGCLFVYTALFGTGKFIFGEPKLGFVLLLIAVLSGLLLFWHLSRQGWQSLSGDEARGNEYDASPVEAGTRD